MDVRYITVKLDRLHTIPVVDGQLIAVEDIDMYLYDMGGVRRTTSGQMHVTELPETGQQNMVYIVTSDEDRVSGIYVWTGKEFFCIANPNTDVTTVPDSSSSKVYFTGTTVGDKTTDGHLKLCKDIYFNAKTGEVTAKKFIGGSAAAADKATTDDRDQNIANTYVKDIGVNDREVTFTRGDDTTEKFTVGHVANTTSPGVVKSGTDIEVDASGNVSVKDNSHNHVVSNISDLTASATELNYMKGVTSGVQSQLNGKVPKTRTVNGYALDKNVTLDYEDVGADAEGTAQLKVSAHNVSTTAHDDIRQLIADIDTRLNAFLDTEDIDLDQLSEIIEYIQSNKELIDAITTSKVSVADIVDNLTSTAKNKPLSANQGRALKALIDALQTSVNANKSSADSALSDHANDTDIHLTVDERTQWNDANTKKHTHSNKTTLDAITAAFTTALKTKLDGIEEGAEVNPNIFHRITVHGPTADGTNVTDFTPNTPKAQIEFYGSNVTLDAESISRGIVFKVTKADVLNALGYTPTTVNIRSGTAAPDNSVGVDGDVYIQILDE